MKRSFAGPKENVARSKLSLRWALRDLEDEEWQKYHWQPTGTVVAERDRRYQSVLRFLCDVWSESLSGDHGDQLPDRAAISSQRCRFQPIWVAIEQLVDWA